VLERLSDLSERIAFERQHSAVLSVRSGASSSEAERGDPLDKQVRELADGIELRASSMRDFVDLWRYANEIQGLAQQVGEKASINRTQEITSELDGLKQRSENIERKYGNSLVLSPKATEEQRRSFVQNAQEFLQEEKRILGDETPTMRDDFKARLSNVYNDIYDLAGQEFKRREKKEAFSGAMAKFFYVVGTFLLLYGGWLKDRDSVSTKGSVTQSTEST
jgi:hypothetical protein